MKAKLIGYTQPVEGAVDGLNDVQDMIAYCAKVSNPKGQMNLETSGRLLNYLIKYKKKGSYSLTNASTIPVENIDIPET